MTQLEALEILWRAAEVAQKSGSLSIQDAVVINAAYQHLKKVVESEIKK